MSTTNPYASPRAENRPLIRRYELSHGYAIAFTFDPAAVVPGTVHRGAVVCEWDPYIPTPSDLGLGARKRLLRRYYEAHNDFLGDVAQLVGATISLDPNADDSVGGETVFKPQAVQ